MQAILVADYSFTPLEYWRGVSLTAREFIRRCLTVEPSARMTAHEALSHPWIADTAAVIRGEGMDLLPVVKKNFNARRTLHAAIDTIRAINQLRAGGAAGMNAAAANRNRENQNPEARRNAAQKAGIAQPEEEDVNEGDAMEIDSRGDARGQTEEMIREQERRIRETSQGIWRR